MYEYSELAEKSFVRDFSKLPKRSPPKAETLPKKPSESSKINKKSLLIPFYSKIRSSCSTYSMKQILISLFHNPLSAHLTMFKILPKTTSDYLLMNNFAFSNAFYRITKEHITTKKSTHSFSNSIPCLNKINTSTSLEDIEGAFIYRDIPIKNRKRNAKANGLPRTLMTFSLVRSSDRTELLKSRFAKQQENISELINGNSEITLKEIRKPQQEIKDLRKEISEFKVSLEFTKNQLHNKMKKIQEKHESINNVIDEI